MTPLASQLYLTVSGAAYHDFPHRNKFIYFSLTISICTQSPPSLLSLSLSPSCHWLSHVVPPFPPSRGYVTWTYSLVSLNYCALLYIHVLLLLLK